MFDHEFSNRNYVLLTQLPSLNRNDIDVVLKGKYKLDIDITSKTPRINIYDVFTLYALLSKEITDDELSQVLKLHNTFVKNYVDDFSLRRNDEFLLLSFMDEIIDENDEEIEVEPQKNKVEGGNTPETRLFNLLTNIKNNIIKTDPRKMYGGKPNEKYSKLISNIKKNDNILNELHDDNLKYDLKKLIKEIEKEYENLNNKTIAYKNELESKKKINKTEFNDCVIIGQPNTTEYQNCYLLFVIISIVFIIILCIICWVVVSSKHKQQALIEINNKYIDKCHTQKDVKPFNLTDELKMKINDVEVQIKNKNNEIKQTKPKQNSDDIKIMKSTMDRDINEVLKIDKPKEQIDSTIRKTEALRAVNVISNDNAHKEQNDDTNIEPLNELLHQMESNNIKKSEDRLFGNLELI